MNSIIKKVNLFFGLLLAVIFCLMPVSLTQARAQTHSIEELDITNPSDGGRGMVVRDFRDNLYLYLKNSTKELLEIENIYVNKMDIKALAEKTRHEPLKYNESNRDVIVWYDIVPNPISAGEWALIRIRFGDINIVNREIDVRLITQDKRSLEFKRVRVFHEQPAIRFKSYSFNPNLDKLFLYLEVDESTNIDGVFLNGKKVTVETFRKIELKDKWVLFLSIPFPQSLREGEYKIIKVKTPDGSNNCLFRVIKPFFPIGLFVIGGDTDGWFMKDCVKHLINFGDHPGHPPDIEARYGIKMFVHPVNMDASFPEHFDWIKKIDDKSVYTWLLIDEPNPKNVDEGSPIKLVGWMNDFRKYGSPHPVFVNHDSEQWASFEYNLTDIVSFDYYPVPGETRIGSAPVKNRGTLYVVSNEMDRLQAVAAPKPVWYIPPAYYTEHEVPQDKLYNYCRLPTPEEERLLVYQSVSHGGKGIIYYSQLKNILEGSTRFLDESKLKAAKLLWEEIGRVNLELHLLGPLLLKGEPLPLGESDQAKVETCSVLSGEDAIVVFLINHDYNSTFDYEKAVFEEAENIKVKLRFPTWFSPVEVFSLNPEALTKLNYQSGINELSFSLSKLKVAQAVVISTDKKLFHQLEKERKRLYSILTER